MVIAISIAVHESPEVLQDQIDNIKKYIRSPIVVIHIGEEHVKDFPAARFEAQENVFVNEKHLRTSWGDIADVHISNFIYIEGKKAFDYFMLHASNDCYVRQGVEAYLCKYRAGFNRRYIHGQSKWCMAKPAGGDFDLKQISRLTHPAGRIVASQVEGSFYRRDIMQQIVQVLAGCSYDKKTLSYTREEFYFSTAAYGMLTEEEIGYPVVFSEVHRFDRSYYRYLEFSGCIWRGRESAAKQAADQFVLKAMHRMKWGALRKKDVQAVRRQINRRLKKNQYLDDGIGKFRLYDTEGLFAVKRVPRDMQNKLRKYIRTLPIQEKGVWNEDFMP